MSRSCPHAEIRFCPLYHAAHEGQGHGCDDGRCAEGGCAAVRGLDYAAAVARLDPVKVGVLLLREESERRRVQHQRDTSRLGAH